MRNLWTKRNDFVFNSSFKARSRVIQSATIDLEDFTEANKPIQQSLGPQLRIEDVKWIPPKQNFVKFNWDSSISAKDHKMGIQIVIKDDASMVLACLSSSKTFYSKLA